MTDCIRTLHERVPVEAALGQIKCLFERIGISVPGENAPPFAPAMALFQRRQRDKIRTVGLLDDAADAGSIMLYAGWLKRGNPRGALNGGHAPVPALLLHAVVKDPLVAAATFFPRERAPHVALTAPIQCRRRMMIRSPAIGVNA